MLSDEIKKILETYNLPLTFGNNYSNALLDIEREKGAQQISQKVIEILDGIKNPYDEGGELDYLDKSGAKTYVWGKAIQTIKDKIGSKKC
jgi:hypothetical protein